MEFDRVEFEGVNVLNVRLPARRSAVASVWFGTGSRDEAESCNGITHLLEHLVVRSPSAVSRSGLTARLEQMGCEVNAVTSKEFLAFYVASDAESIAESVRLLCEHIATASPTAEDIARERSVVLEELALAEADPSDVIHDIFYASVFYPRRLALPSGGTKEVVRELDQEVIRKEWSRILATPDLNILVAGSVETEHVQDVLSGSALVKRGESGRRSALRNLPLSDGWRWPLPVQSEYQYIMAGGESRPYGHCEGRAFDVLATLLGNSSGSIVQGAIRGNLGLAYDGFSWNVPLTDTGLFRIGIGTSPGNVDQVIEALEWGLRRQSETGWNDAEVKVAARLTDAREMRRLDDLVDLSMHLGRQVIQGGVPPEWAIRERGSQAVSATDVNHALQDMLHGLVVERTDRPYMNVPDGGYRSGG